MQALHLYPDEFTSEERVLLRKLQTTCAACETPTQCARDLNDELVDPGWQDWRNYCPNATQLNMLSVLSAASLSVHLRAWKSTPG
jgi:hypothetical protein